MYRIFPVCLMMVLLSTQSYSSHIVVSGVVSGTWDVDTVFVSDNLLVQSGQVLGISPGTLVIFSGHYTFKIEGQVLAEGLAVDSILFTVADTTGFSNLETVDGSWDGLWFYHLAPVNDSSVFEYCRFEYGKAAFDADTINWYGGAVCVREFDRLRFSHCRFVNNRAYKNGGALYARQANINIDHCRFENNFCGQAVLNYGYGGGVCLEYSDAIVHRNYFTQNSSTGVGGGLSFEYSDPAVCANHFVYNYSALGGGFTCLRSEGVRPVVNNLVESNSSLYFGGGIAVLQTTAPMINNTVVSNYSGAGGGLYFNASSFAVFKNCIVWGNYDFGGGGPQVYIWDTFSAPEFYYCDVEGGVELFGGTGGGGGGFIGIFENCIDSDPGFCGTGQNPWQPAQNSVCINHGTPDTTGLCLPETDFAGNNRFLNVHIDIGAYETQILTSETEIANESPVISVFPNPASEIITLSADQDIKSVALCHISGVILHQWEDLRQPSVSLDISGLPTGIYLLRTVYNDHSGTLCKVAVK